MPPLTTGYRFRVNNLTLTVPPLPPPPQILPVALFSIYLGTTQIPSGNWTQALNFLGEGALWVMQKWHMVI